MKARLDDYRDVPAPEAAGQGQRQLGGGRRSLAASDASDVAPRDAAPGACPELPAAGVEKSAGQALDGRAQDAKQSELQALAARSAELCKPDAGLSAEQSCADLAPAASAGMQSRQLQVLNSQAAPAKPLAQMLESGGPGPLGSAVLPPAAAPVESLLEYERLALLLVAALPVLLLSAERLQGSPTWALLVLAQRVRQALLAELKAEAWDAKAERAESAAVAFQ